MELRQWLDAAAAIREDLIAWRRDFHRHPELGFREKRTSGIVEAHLRGLPLEVRTGIGGTGITAVLRGEQDGPVIALRADMDALPIQEETGCAYQSTVPGVAHLCGHDAHTSMLMGAARILCEHGRPKKGSIKFIFQPAEEGLAGAAAMIRDGALDDPKVDAVAALHVQPTIPLGRFKVVRGTSCACAERLELKIIGEGGHAARPHETIDAIAVAGQVITAIQNIVSRFTDPLETAVITIGTIEGGYASNVIAPEVRMSGTIRTFSPNVRLRVHELLHRTIRGVIDAFGASYELVIHEGYPPVVNDDAMVDHFIETNERLFGEPRWEYGQPSTGGEDFAYFAQQIPGVFFRLGVNNGSAETSYPLHHPKFNLDESALPLGTAMLAAVAVHYLEKA
jgi:amidohydrolase